MVRVIKTKPLEKAIEKPIVKQEQSMPDIKYEPQFQKLIKEKSTDVQNEIQRLAKIAYAQISFYGYCKAIDPQFYVPEAEYLKTYCETLQAIWEKRIYSVNIHLSNSIKETEWLIAKTAEEVPECAYVCSNIIINMPPQRLKTRTLTHFCCWILGKDPTGEHIGCVSYNNDTASDMSKYTRNEIAEARQNKSTILFSDIFPEVRLNPKDKSVERWSLENSYFSYLSSGYKGGVTGKGFTTKIIDDPIKNAEEAFNETVCNDIYSFYSDTWESRKNLTAKRALDIVNFTRWSEFDLCQKIIDAPYGKYYYHLVFKEYDSETDKMLCEKFATKEDYDMLLAKKIGDISLAVFYANYNQEIIQTGNSLYGNNIKEYDYMPTDNTGKILSSGRRAYVDVADKGTDYLCAIAYNDYKAMAYVQDVYYTQDPQSITEDKMVDFIINNQLTEITFESNNGGGEYGRHIEIKVLGRAYYRCKFKYIWNKSNKFTRILTAQNDVLSRVFMPKEWISKWHKFAVDIKKFQKNEKDNEHDDCADGITGVIDTLGFNHKSVKAKVC